MFKPLSSIIDARRHKKGLYLQVEAAMILEFFKDLIKERWGGELTQTVEPVSVKNKRMKVRCPSAQLITEMRLVDTELIEAINKKFKKGVVSSIQFILV